MYFTTVIIILSYFTRNVVMGNMWLELLFLSDVLHHKGETAALHFTQYSDSSNCYQITVNTFLTEALRCTVMKILVTRLYTQ